MATLVLALLGPPGVVALGLGARRVAAAERARALGSRARRRLPRRVRVWLEHALRDANVAVDPESAVTLWLVSVSGVVIVAIALTPSLALPAAVLGLAAGPTALRITRRRGERQFVAALPLGLEHVASALRGGTSLTEAVGALGEHEGPLAPDMRAVRSRVGLGLSLGESLAVWAHERPLPGVRAAAGALGVAASVGGRSAAALDALAQSMSERSGVIAEARALSTQSRLSAIVVGALPVGFVALSALTGSSSVRTLVSTPAGRVCLVLGLALDGLAALWIRRIVGSSVQS